MLSVFACIFLFLEHVLYDVQERHTCLRTFKNWALYLIEDEWHDDNDNRKRWLTRIIIVISIVVVVIDLIVAAAATAIIAVGIDETCEACSVFNQAN